MRTLRMSAPLLGLSLGAVLTSACAPVADDNPDAGSGPVEPDTDAGPDSDGGTPPAGRLAETCAAAVALTPGVAVTGTTAGAADDYQGGCDQFSDGPGGDVVYSFTLEAESGVEVALSGYDAILYVYSGEACTEEVRCNDTEDTSETLSIPALPAGEYFLVVDTYIGPLADDTRQDDGGSFTLTLTLTEPQCEADQFDTDGDNDSPDNAVFAGANDIDTRDLDPSTAEEDTIRLNLCSGDVDYFSVGHLGGTLAASAFGVGVSPTPDYVLLSATATVEDGRITGYTEGAPVDSGSEQPRGAYLLKVSSAAALPATGAAYGFTVSHGCPADEGDSFVAELDDGDVKNANLYLNALATPESHTVCGEDSDAFVLHNLVAGDITVTLAGAGTLTSTVQVWSVSEDAQGVRSATALDASAYTVVAQNSDAVITVPGAATGKYAVSLAASGTTPVAYTFQVAFAGIAGPPANNTCTDRETLVASEDPTPVFGRTLGATHAISGPMLTMDGDSFSCNGDAEADPSGEVGPAADVFYYLSLPSAVNLDIFVDGTLSDFSSSLYVLQLPGAMCPADLSTLTPVSVGGEPVCENGVKSRARIPMAPAGDYLVVVDGQHVDFAFFGLLYNTEGAFEIRAKTYAGDFPPPEACTAATALDLPTAGAPVSFQVDYAGAPQELQADCGGRGAERVFTLTPAADVSLTIEAGGGDDDVDTVVYLMEGTCTEAGAEAATEDDGVCNDDGGGLPNYGSSLTVSLTAGTTYYLVVDSYSATSGTAGVSISLAE